MVQGKTAIHTRHKVLPPAPAELVTEMSRRYVQMYEQITGEKLVPGATPIDKRIEKNLALMRFERAA